MSAGTVAEVFEKPEGPLRLDKDGRWWMTRAFTGLDSEGRITILVGDGAHVATINGTPEGVRRLAEAITAQADGAVANSRSTP